MTTPAEELRDLIRSKLTDDMTADQAADTIAALFYRVEDDWESIDISTVADGPGGALLDQRWLVVRIPREARHRDRKADRAVNG